MKVVFVLIFTICVSSALCAKLWTWQCVNRRCIKTRAESQNEIITHPICELTCYEYSRIWPMPNGRFEIDPQIVPIDLDFQLTQTNAKGLNSPLLQAMILRFESLITKFNDNKANTTPVPQKTVIQFNIKDVINTKLHLNISERYQLHIIENSDNAAVEIVVSADTIFGARHALESLSQVVVYNEITGVYVVPKRLYIDDTPKYPVRGVVIDSSRNFLAVSTIKRTIESMALNKLNSLHWHLTDTQSFPFQSVSLPHLSELGAYSPEEIYDVASLRDIFAWAAIRGVRIIPEIDGPAHVGEGWQDSGFLLCFKETPYYNYCQEPPCGIFDPTKSALYPTLQSLYHDIIDIFDPVAFHFGGDEVKFLCWEKEPAIVQWMAERGMPNNSTGYVQLWSYYHENAYNAFIKERGHDVPGILWTSTLTDSEHLSQLQNDKFIVHVWTEKGDQTIKHLLENDFKIIISNYDTMYLDCGFHMWTTAASGLNWCAPYNTWKDIYENSPAKIVASFGNDTNKPHLIMGAMSALWTETVDDASTDNRIWPRASAMAERLWTEPTSTWQDAQFRLESQRRRMIKDDIHSDSLMPEWCYYNQDSCK